jgi:hypothetical protein
VLATIRSRSPSGDQRIHDRFTVVRPIGVVAPPDGDTSDNASAAPWVRASTGPVHSTRAVTVGDHPAK